ncbi:MAG: S8 family serine peptidase [Gemmobacter sp.]|nr:S8 family serine peptidase [Gemmobacter sp.]
MTGPGGRNSSTNPDPTFPNLDYTNNFNGTSAATPTVAGPDALMLDANDALDWRDIKSILAASASHTGSACNGAGFGTERGVWLSGAGTDWNGGGTAVHMSCGFGMLDVFAAVRMAEIWTVMQGASATSANEQTVSLSYSGGRLAIPDAYCDANFNVHDGVRAVSLNVTQDIKISRSRRPMSPSTCNTSAAMTFRCILCCPMAVSLR